MRLSGGTPVQTRKLMGLGVLPGVVLELRRRRPLVVFRLGFAQFALDPALAGAIRVRPRRG
jgi:Fe2+ transport system protein FeoA